MPIERKSLAHWFCVTAGISPCAWQHYERVMIGYSQDEVLEACVALLCEQEQPTPKTLRRYLYLVDAKAASLDANT